MLPQRSTTLALIQSWKKHRETWPGRISYAYKIHLLCLFEPHLTRLLIFGPCLNLHGVNHWACAAFPRPGINWREVSWILIGNNRWPIEFTFCDGHCLSAEPLSPKSLKKSPVRSVGKAEQDMVNIFVQHWPFNALARWSIVGRCSGQSPRFG